MLYEVITNHRQESVPGDSVDFVDHQEQRAITFLQQARNQRIGIDRSIRLHQPQDDIDIEACRTSLVNHVAVERGTCLVDAGRIDELV